MPTDLWIDTQIYQTDISVPDHLGVILTERPPLLGLVACKIFTDFQVYLNSNCPGPPYYLSLAHLPCRSLQSK